MSYLQTGSRNTTHSITGCGRKHFRPADNVTLQHSWDHHPVPYKPQRSRSATQEYNETQMFFQADVSLAIGVAF